ADLNERRAVRTQIESRIQPVSAAAHARTLRVVGEPGTELGPEGQLEDGAAGERHEGAETECQVHLAVRVKRGQVGRIDDVDRELEVDQETVAKQEAHQAAKTR